MKHIYLITTCLFLLIPNNHILSRDYYTEFKEFQDKSDTLNQRLLLAEWEKENPEDPELYTSYFNYYFFISRQEYVYIDREASDGLSVSIEDSTGNNWYLTSSFKYDMDKLSIGFNYIDIGIEKFPRRLDMRFGKIYTWGQVENWEEFTKEILKTIDYSNEIKNDWLWTKNEPSQMESEEFLGSVQDYIVQLFNTGDEALLVNMRKISEKALEYYPDHIESLANVATTYLAVGDYDKALEKLLKIEKIAPDDCIVLSNIALAYKWKGDKENAIKYFEKVIKYGEGEIKENAEEEIKMLKEELDAK